MIPMRGGSAGIPDKNIQDVEGAPLFSYILNTLLQVSEIERVVVSTDSEKYAELARGLGANVPFLRPANLADGKTRLHYVMQHALHESDALDGPYDAVLSALATAPLVRADTVRSLIETMKQTDCEAVATGSPIKTGHPYLAKYLSEDGCASDVLSLPEGTPRYPRQVRPDTYFFNGCLFLRKRHLLEPPDDSTNALGIAPRMVVTSEPESLNIDDLEDLDRARAFIKSAV